MTARAASPRSVWLRGLPVALKASPAILAAQRAPAERSAQSPSMGEAGKFPADTFNLRAALFGFDLIGVCEEAALPNPILQPPSAGAGRCQVKLPAGVFSRPLGRTLGCLLKPGDFIHHRLLLRCKVRA